MVTLHVIEQLILLGSKYFITVKALRMPYIISLFIFSPHAVFVSQHTPLCFIFIKTCGSALTNSHTYIHTHMHTHTYIYMYINISYSHTYIMLT